MSGRARMVGDLLVWGSNRDSRLVCCLSGASVQDVSGGLHGILRRRESSHTSLCMLDQITWVEKGIKSSKIIIGG